MFRYLAWLLIVPGFARAEAPPLPIELQAIPNSSAGFVTIKIPEFWKTPLFAEMRKPYDSDEFRMITRVVMGFEFEALDRVTYILPVVDAATDMLPFIPGDIHSAILLHTLKQPIPKNPRLGLTGYLSTVPATKYKGFEYHADGDGWMAIHFLNERSYAMGTVKSIRWLIDHRAERKPSPFDATLHAAEQHTIVMGMSAQTAHYLAKEVLSADLLREIAPWFRVESTMLAATFDQKMRFRWHADYATVEQRQGAEKAIAFARKTAVDELESQLAKFAKNQPNRGAGEEPSEQEKETTNLLLDEKDFMLQLKPTVKDRSLTIAFESTNPTPFNLWFPFIGKTLWVSGPTILRADEFPKRDAQIATALEAYHQEHGHYPAPAIYSKDGKPLLSWRVALLPYLGNEAKKLHARFRLDEAWDSKHNQPLLDQMPWVFSGMSSTRHRPRPHSAYRIFVGKGGMMEGPTGISKKAITDKPDETLIAIRGGYSSTPWTSPEELELKNELPKLDEEDVVEAGIFADGHTELLALKDTKVLRAMLTRQGGEKVTIPPREAKADPRQPFIDGK